MTIGILRSTVIIGLVMKRDLSSYLPLFYATIITSSSWEIFMLT